MSYPVFYVVEGDTLPILFDTFAGSTGASVTMSGLAVTDIEIYKDGGTTQRASDAGYTLLDTDGIDFDSLTGIHGFSIDLSDNTDSGFYTVGPWYHVVVSAVTIDSQTVSFVAAAFRILDATRGMAGTALPDAAADAAGGLPISDAGALDLDTQFAKLDTIDNFLDTEVAAILEDTGTTLPATLATIAGYLDTEIAAILVDTGTTIPAQISALSIPTAAAIADAVWEEALADHEDTVGSTAEALADAGGSGASAADIADAVLNEALSGHTTAGTLGKAVADILVDTGTTIPASLDALPTAAEIVTQMGTGTFLTAIPWNAAWDAEVQSEATDALNAYDPPTNAEMEARTLLAAAYATAANQTTMDGKLDTIDNFLDTEMAAILAAVDTEIAAILVDTGTDIPATLSSLLATAMTEGYRSTGATGSVRDLLYEILANIVEFSNAGTTRTAKKLDGSTTAKTYTYDDADNPTSITETT